MLPRKNIQKHLCSGTDIVPIGTELQFNQVGDIFEVVMVEPTGERFWLNEFITYSHAKDDYDRRVYVRKTINKLRLKEFN